jgi:hypothetical protein
LRNALATFFEKTPNSLRCGKKTRLNHAEVRTAASPFIRQQRQAMISFIAKQFIGQPRDECPDNNQIDQNDQQKLLGQKLQQTAEQEENMPSPLASNCLENFASHTCNKSASDKTIRMQRGPKKIAATSTSKQNGMPTC